MALVVFVREENVRTLGSLRERDFSERMTNFRLASLAENGIRNLFGKYAAVFLASFAGSAAAGASLGSLRLPRSHLGL